jgi:hypothetical protein
MPIYHINMARECNFDGYGCTELQERDILSKHDQDLINLIKRCGVDYCNYFEVTNGGERCPGSRICKLRDYAAEKKAGVSVFKDVLTMLGGSEQSFIVSKSGKLPVKYTIQNN